MPKFAANLTMMFNEIPFPERFAAAAKAGFSAVEFLFPYDYPVADVTRWLKEKNLKSALFNMPPGDWAAGERGIASLPGREDEFMAGVHTAIEYALAMGTPTIHAMAGLVPADADRPAYRATYVKNIGLAAKELAKHGLTLLIEPINTFDIPGFWLNRTAQAIALIEEVGSSNLWLQHDIYHMQRMEGELATTIARHLPKIAHMQIADNPGRNEPGTGEINYAWLFRFIDQLGYDGWIGCEYKPAAGTREGLGWIKALAG